MNRQRERTKGSKRQAKMNSKKQAKGLLKSDSETTTKENNVLVDAINMANSNDDLLEMNGVLKNANILTFTRDLVPPLEDIQPVVLYDSNITVESDIVTGIKGDPAEVTTKKATVEQKVQVTPERVVTREKGGNPSKSINPLIHFGNDKPFPPVPSSLVALNSTHSIMHSSIEDGNRTIFISGMPEAPVTDPVAADAHNRNQILRIGQLLSPTFTLLFLPH
ncbi:hypothetical protein ACOME3_010160 [Neoechinorhynchus agilis]